MPLRNVTMLQTMTAFIFCKYLLVEPKILLIFAYSQGHLEQYSQTLKSLNFGILQILKNEKEVDSKNKTQTEHLLRKTRTLQLLLSLLGTPEEVVGIDEIFIHGFQLSQIK